MPLNLYIVDLLKSEVFWDVMCHWVLRSFEMSGTALPTTQHCKPDDFNLHQYHCENLKYRNSWLVFCEKMSSRSRIWHCASVWVVPDISKAPRSLKTLRTTHPVTAPHHKKTWIFSNAALRTSNTAENVKSMGSFPRHHKWFLCCSASHQVDCATFLILKLMLTLMKNLYKMETC